jgi:hypothetical protein
VETNLIRYLVLSEITMSHNFIHIRYTPGNRPWGVCNIRWSGMYIQIDSFRASPMRIGNNISNIRRAISRWFYSGSLFRNRRIHQHFFEPDLYRNCDHNVFNSRKRKEEECDALFA